MINIGDWIKKWSFLQPHKKTLIFEELPKTASGKIQKFVLKEWLKNRGQGPKDSAVQVT
jgi:acyl-coenzyme A synthetase/AMP-(fatty) acid ligase